MRSWEATTLVIGLLVGMLTGCASATPSLDTIAQTNPGLAAAYAQETQQVALSLAGAQMTIEAGTQIANIQQVQATGTAYAPFAAMTDAQAQLNIQAMRSAATDTQAAKDATATAAQWTPTITSTPTPNLTSTVAVQAFINQQKKDEADANFNQFWAYAKVIAFLTFIFGIVIAGLTTLRLVRKKPIKRDENGKIESYVDIYTGRAVDLNANPNYNDEDVSILKQMFIQYMQRKYGFVPATPQITEERQDKVKEREQIIEIERIRRSRLPKALIDEQGMRFLPEPEEENPESDVYPELSAPSWVELNRWDGKLLPIGNNAESNLIRLDMSIRPHLMYVGRSRSGKTLTGERTSSACLLTQGWNVIVMGKRVDWMPFVDHPNFKLLAVDVRKDARRYIELLQILSAQMDIRDSLLASKHISTWDRYGAPSTMIFMDDYSGALIRMPKKEAAEVVGEVRSIAMDAAKFGISLTVGIQDATAQNIDTTTRSQMARIVYSVDTGGKSIIALGEKGAEKLPPFRHFLTKMSDDAQIERGVGFFLEDRQVEAFLQSRPVKTNEPNEWIDAVVSDIPTLTKQDSPQISAPMNLGEFVSGLSEWEVKVLDLYVSGIEQEHIVESVFAGDNPEVGKAAVADVIRRWKVVKGSGTSPVVVSEQAEVKKEIVEMAEKIRSQWIPGLSLNKTSKLLGKPYAGNLWCSQVNEVVDYLTTTTVTTTDENRVISPDFGAVTA